MGRVDSQSKKKKEVVNIFSATDFFNSSSNNLVPNRSNLMKRKSADFTNHKIRKQLSSQHQQRKQEQDFNLPMITISCDSKHSERSGLIMVAQSITSPVNSKNAIAPKFSDHDAKSNDNADSLLPPE